MSFNYFLRNPSQAIIDILGTLPHEMCSCIKNSTKSQRMDAQQRAKRSDFCDVLSKEEGEVVKPYFPPVCI